MKRHRTHRRRLPKPDKDKRIRPVVGINQDGKKQRFFVGRTTDTTEAEMERRLHHIMDLYDRQCDELAIEFWANWTLPWAKRMAEGIPVKVTASSYAKTNPGQAAEEWMMVKRLESWGVPMQITDTQLIAEGSDFVKQQVREQVNQAVHVALNELGQDWSPKAIEEVQQRAIPDDILNAETTSFHEAIEAYIEHITSNRRSDSSYPDNCEKLSKYLKEHHEDLPLWQLRLPQVQAIAAYWENRPGTKRGREHCSYDHAHGMLKNLFRILEWIDGEPTFRWNMPEKARAIKRTPRTFGEDRPRTPFANTVQKATYTPEELAILAEHADHFGRTLIAVCVNCAFGASEIGRWSMDLYSLFTAHPHADKIGIDSTKADSWITGYRPKTAHNKNPNYGEHLLWPQVAQALERYEDGRTVLPVWSTGNPWWNQRAKNKQSAFTNWWTDLKTKVNEDGFPKLSFGSLRDTLPNVLRAKYDGEIAELCLQHITLTKDPLLDCYTNRPFKRLFDATRELEGYYMPLLDLL